MPRASVDAATINSVEVGASYALLRLPVLRHQWAIEKYLSSVIIYGTFLPFHVFRHFQWAAAARHNGVTTSLNGNSNFLVTLPDHLALIADAVLAFVGESLHACENRIGIEMRFRDHFQFEAATSPAIVEVGGE